MYVRNYRKSMPNVYSGIYTFVDDGNMVGMYIILPIRRFAESYEFVELSNPTQPNPTFDSQILHTLEKLKEDEH